MQIETGCDPSETAHFNSDDALSRIALEQNPERPGRLSLLHLARRQPGGGVGTVTERGRP